ncbi:FMN-binding negative transcriptional regulator [Novosphingobium profundi]|uniref:FMN-binding negative transcriptional regulator n=1 Tax=Novosphingobium profundi TaxID=1774954 RepID=UPI001BD997D9|nr:FMN-binding negative transcriptional regulator [Novosphingobium profundi]MBT0668026.1 FMN-binding negative transcriptional regulator [Novosphingobium profundi]
MLNPKFARYGAEDLRRLIADYPMAWVLAPGAPIETATLLPLLGSYDADGRLTGLVGHMVRRRELLARLSQDPRVQVLFTGPQGYVSPEHAGRRNWGPTWNYAALRIEAQVRFDAALTGPAIAQLVDQCEKGRGAPWTSEELGSRYTGMLEAVIGFEMTVTALDATFKLAQDEDDAVLANLVEAHPDPALRTWMRALNADRLAPDMGRTEHGNAT